MRVNSSGEKWCCAVCAHSRGNLITLEPMCLHLNRELTQTELFSTENSPEGCPFNNAKEDKLKSCPFCGSNRIRLYTTSECPEAWCECIDCEARTRMSASDKGAIKVWNARI